MTESGADRRPSRGPGKGRPPGKGSRPYRKGSRPAGKGMRPVGKGDRFGPRRDAGPRDRGPRPAYGAPARFQPKKATARAVASQILMRIESSPGVLVSDLLAELSTVDELVQRERRFLLELVYGVLRHRLTLDCIITAYSREPIAKLDTGCLMAVRLALYQMLFLGGVPTFAAISESLEMLSHTHQGIRSFANGVLRTVDRESKKVELAEDRGDASPRKRLSIGDTHVVFFSRNVFADPEDSRALHLAQLHSYPPFLVERWLARYDRAVVEEMLIAGNRKPPVTLRANRLKTDRDGLVRRLATEGIAAGSGTLPESVAADAPTSELVASAAFKEGLFYLQDEAAMKVANRLEPKPGERILDLCCAPGGKATHLAELSAEQAEIVAVDRDEARLSLVRENCARLGVKSVRPLRFDPMRDEKLPADHAGLYDAILLDAPCSNTGVLSRRPEVRWRVSRQAIRGLSARSRELFSWAVKQLRPGGRILLSTCSLEPEENEENVTRLMVANPSLELVHQEETLPSTRGPDGGFLALFRLT